MLSARDLGLEVLALRPRFVVGAGDTSIFPRMIQAHRKGRLRILGNGLNRVDFTSVHNLNDALFSCLLAGERRWARSTTSATGSRYRSGMRSTT